MTTIYFKATRPNGKDFFSGTVDYAGALDFGKRVRIRSPKKASYSCCTPDVLHASDVPTETLISGSWPCRLFEVKGRPVAQEGHKYGFRSLSVIREVDATLALGPQGAQIAALIERASRLSVEDVRRLGAVWSAARAAARDAAWGAAWGAVRDAARDAAWGAAWGAAWDAARDAAGGAAWGAAGLVVRDLIGDRFTQDQYDLLTRPWREAIGPIHPDDAPMGAWVL